MAKIMRTNPKQFGRVQNRCESVKGQGISLRFIVTFWASQRNWLGLLIPVSLLAETPIEVILLRVLFTAKVLTNLRWQGRGGGGVHQRRQQSGR